MKIGNFTIKLNDKVRFGCGDVIAVYGNASRNTHGLGRCMAAAAISGSLEPFSTDREDEMSLLVFDTLNNDFDTSEATDAIYNIAELIGIPEDPKVIVGSQSAITCAEPKDIRSLMSLKIAEFKPDILIISGAEDILENVRSLADVRGALRLLKRIAQFTNGTVIAEFGLNQKHMGLIKTELIDNCNYAFHTEEDKSTGRITVTATRWEGEPIPTMYIDTDPEGTPTITIDESEGE